MYETLLSPEEMTKATDQGDYFRVPLDARSLDYSKYVEDGETEAAAATWFDSNNTEQMDVEQAKALLATLPEMRGVIGGTA